MYLWLQGRPSWEMRKHVVNKTTSGEKGHAEVE
jgi:hypothetical protein